MNRIRFLFFARLLAPISVLYASAGLANPLSVSTHPWPPYINASQEPLGSAADLLRQIMSQDNIDLHWRYQNYDLAFELVASDKQQAAFPYFKTELRQQRVLFSQPIFSVKTRVYFNRKRVKPQNLEALQGKRFGRVYGYSYGQIIDAYLSDAREFSSEKKALESLFNGDIDFLPMTESVMNNMLNRLYSDQSLLIQHVDKLVGHDALHLIAPNTEAGAALILNIDRLLMQSQKIKSLQPEPEQRIKKKDIARLITAEGYPAIVGQTTPHAESVYYTLPLGTRVLVLQWSEKILKPSITDRIYKSMMDLSQVVILNGPHVGKELYIKNMHLEVQ